MNKNVLAGGLSLLFLGCATPSPRKAMVESPVPQATQAAAQQAAQAPAAPRYKRKVAIGRFTNETTYGRSLLSDADLDRIGKQASDMLASRLVMSGQFLVLERPDRFPRPQHRLLHHVLGQLAVPAEPERESQQVRPQALAQGAKTPTGVRFGVAAVHV